MATAPFQLWLDLAAIQSATRTSSTVTVTTYTPHGISTGAYVQMQDASGTPGTSMNGVYQITATSGTTFTYTAAGSAGTADTGSAVVSYDLLNPLINYSGTAKEQALYVPTESLLFAVSGDGSGASSSFRVAQDDTPTDGPWFKLIPDQARVRLVRANTGVTPAADKSDLYFVSAIATIQARLNGAGLGTLADVALQDSTSLLERIYVYSYNVQSHVIARNGLVRSSNVVTVTTNTAHGYSNGGTVAISGATGGGNAEFNDNSTTIANVTATTFTYDQNGDGATGNQEISISSAQLFGTALNRVELTLPAGSNVLDTNGVVIISGITSNVGIAQDYVNSVFEGFSRPGANKIVVDLVGSVAGTATFDTTNGKLIGLAIVEPLNVTNDLTLQIDAGELETDAVKDVLTAINKVKSADYALQRLINTAGTANIVGASNLAAKQTIEIPAQTVRGVLDTIVEHYQGLDGKPRRYFVDPTGNLNYGLVDAGAKPTYATAPYKLITSGTQNPDTTTGAATLIPYSLEVGYDHQTTKSAVVTNQGTAYEPTITTYLDYDYAIRRGAPFFDGTIEVPDVTSGLTANAYRYSKSFFLEAHLPLMSGYVTLRGAGTAAHNLYGFGAGYAQTGASTYALVNRWLPGQWVDITCAELGLSGLYRVEQVNWGLEPGSFTQIITLTFSYKPQYSLSNLLKSGA
jgi:hypothetical protein